MTDSDEPPKLQRAEPNLLPAPVLFKLPPGLTQGDLELVLARELAKRVPPAEAEQQAKSAFVRIAYRETRTEETYHEGPLPPAEKAEIFERNSPGSIARMFSMAEKDQDAVIEVRRDIIRRDDRFRLLALCGGVVALFGICAAVIWLALSKHDWVAGSLATIGLAGVIGAIVNARLGSSNEKSGVELQDEDETPSKGDT